MLYLKRKIDAFLSEWKANPDKKPLIVKGPRQVGKTESIQRFAAENYTSVITINFVEEPKYKMITADGYKAADIIKNISRIDPSKRFIEGETLIFFDELQEFPDIATALKFFKIDGRFDVICSGSMLGLNYRKIESNSVGYKTDYEMFSLDFEEFLWASEDTFTMPLMREHFANRKPMGALHQGMMRSFSEYMLVGGMPQVVQAFVNGKDFGKADFVKQQIITLYKNDMQEQNEENSVYVRNFFDRIPSELSKHDKRYVLSHIDSSARIRNYQGPIRWLDEAMIVNLASKVDDPSAAFNLGVTDPAFKCYLSDTGLLVSLAFSDRLYLENELYRAVLRDQLQVNEGMLVENVVAQCLKANGHRAYFYVERNPETRKTTMEIDFLIRQAKKIIPIEVKSSGASSIKSLQRFKEKFGKRIGQAIVLHHGEIKCQDDVWYLPYYMATLL